MKTQDAVEFEHIFYPRGVALIGASTENGYSHSLTNFKLWDKLYLVNPRYSELAGKKCFTSILDIPADIDFVVIAVPARQVPTVLKECIQKGVKAAHVFTAGFSETGIPERIKLENEVRDIAKGKIRLIGPNCMGIYCPQSRLSFSAAFPREIGPVGVISQSGGNSIYLVRQAALRGVRFSKVISYGNACDINENDLLEYLAGDPDTKIIALYIEGIKDGKRFRRALEEATKEKTVVLLKGGTSEGGARAVAGHTASLAGNQATWDALCKQFGVISVSCIEEMIDVLVTLLFLPAPQGRNALLFGAGGGASVLIADQFEDRGLKVPAIPAEMVDRIREFTPIAGNILRNPVDYSQAMFDTESVLKTFAILSGWQGADFVVMFIRTGQFTASRISDNQLRHLLMSRFPIKQGQFPKPVAMVIEPSIMPEEAKAILSAIQGSVSSGLPVYYSFASAATAINLVLSHAETQSRRGQGTLVS